MTLQKPNSMWRYAGRRLAALLLALLVLSVLVFIVNEAITDTECAIEKWSEGDVELAEEMTRYHALDRSLIVQYLRWMELTLRGRWGESPVWKEPVRDTIGRQLTYTLIISTAAFTIGCLIAFPISVLSALKRGSFGDRLFREFARIGSSVQLALLGIAGALLVFWLWRTIPSDTGHFPVFLLNAVSVFILSLACTAILVRRTRDSLLGESLKEYLADAEAMGFPRSRMILRLARMSLGTFLGHAQWVIPGVISSVLLVSLFIGEHSLLTLLPYLGCPPDLDMIRTPTLWLVAFPFTVIFLLQVVSAWLDPRKRGQGMVESLS